MCVQGGRPCITSRLGYWLTDRWDGWEGVHGLGGEGCHTYVSTTKHLKSAHIVCTSVWQRSGLLSIGTHARMGGWMRSRLVTFWGDDLAGLM